MSATVIAEASWVRTSDTGSLFYLDCTPPALKRTVVLGGSSVLLCIHTFHSNARISLHALTAMSSTCSSFFWFLLFCHFRVFIIIRFFLHWLVWPLIGTRLTLYGDCHTASLALLLLTALISSFEMVRGCCIRGPWATWIPGVIMTCRTSQPDDTHMGPLYTCIRGPWATW